MPCWDEATGLGFAKNLPEPDRRPHPCPPGGKPHSDLGPGHQLEQGKKTHNRPRASQIHIYTRAHTMASHTLGICSVPR